jgi:hypothetical protein
VIERASPERVSTELIIRMSILLDHLPTNFDVAFSRALESLTVKDEVPLNNEDKTMCPEIDELKKESRPSMQDKISESVAEIGLKGTTERSGGEGNVLGQDQQGR